MGWTQAFSEYWRGFADFKGHVSRASFWRANVLASGIGLFLFLLIGFAGTPAVPVFFLWLLANAIPSAAIVSRRLRAMKAEKPRKASSGAVQRTPISPEPAKQTEAPVGSEVPEKKARVKRPSKEERKERSRKQKERKAEAEKAHREKYGKPIASGAFGWTLVEVFKTGHVRISGGAMQELYGIEFTDLSQRKNQIGRVVGFLGTGGLNMATSTRKGEAYLSVSTPSGVRTLKTSEARPSDIETANKLVAASKAVAGRAKSEQTAATAGPDDLSIQLQRLDELKKTGGLTEDEFSAAKKKLLG